MLSAKCSHFINGALVGVLQLGLVTANLLLGLDEQRLIRKRKIILRCFPRGQRNGLRFFSFIGLLTSGTLRTSCTGQYENTGSILGTVFPRG